FLIDGDEAAFDDTAPFAATIPTDGLAPGIHTMTAVTCDLSHRCASNPSNERTFDVRDRLFPMIVRVGPDPFNPKGPARLKTTTVDYTLDVDSLVTLTISRASGSTVRGPIDLGEQQSGQHTYTWNGRDNGGSTVPSGRYQIELDTTLPSGASAPVG